MAKPPKHKNEKSDITVRKERDLKEFGTFPREGLPWTQDDYDTLATLFLGGHGIKPTIMAALGRSEETIHTYGRKIAFRYGKDNTEGTGPLPRCKIDRRNDNWNKEEIEFLRKASGKYRRFWTDEEIAVTLGRTAGAVRRRIEQMQQAGRPTLFAAAAIKNVGD